MQFLAKQNFFSLFVLLSFVQHVHASGVVTEDSAQQEMTPSSTNEQAYVANRDDNSVSIIALQQEKELAVLEVGLAPSSIVPSQDGSRVYVSNTESDTVSVIDTLRQEIVNTIGVGATPESLALSADGVYLYVVDRTQNMRTVSVYLTTTGERIGGVIPQAMSEEAPCRLTRRPDGKQIYVACGTPFFSALNIPSSVLEEISEVETFSFRPGELATDIAFFPNSTKAYIAVQGSPLLGTVSHISVFDVERSEGIGFIPSETDTPSSLTMSSKGSYLVAGDRFENLSFRYGATSLSLLDGIELPECLLCDPGIAISSNEASIYYTDAIQTDSLIHYRPGTREVSFMKVGEGPVDVGLVSPDEQGTPVSCPGDCNKDGEVTVDEIIRGVRIALGEEEIDRCRNADITQDGLVTVDEISQAIQVALNTCPHLPSLPAMRSFMKSFRIVADMETPEFSICAPPQHQTLVLRESGEKYELRGSLKWKVKRESKFEDIFNGFSFSLRGPHARDLFRREYTGEEGRERGAKWLFRQGKERVVVRKVSSQYLKVNWRVGVSSEEAQSLQEAIWKRHPLTFSLGLNAESNDGSRGEACTTHQFLPKECKLYNDNQSFRCYSVSQNYFRNRLL